jgi:glucosylceramidase
VDQQTFITQFLGPAVQNAGLKTKLLIWDHNYEQSGTNMIDQVLISLQKKEMRQHSGGAAFHCYSNGNIASLASIPQTYPGQDIYMTECSSGTWRNWKDQFNYDAASWIIDPLRAGAKVVLKWGLILDENHKPYLTAYSGSCTGCIGSIVIRNKPDGSYTGQWDYDRDYYILGQISKFVQPGAYRIESNEPPGGVLKNVAFINTDNSKVLYVFNSSAEARNFEVQTSSGRFRYNIPPQSVVTFRWN